MAKKMKLVITPINKKILNINMAVSCQLSSESATAVTGSVIVILDTIEEMSGKTYYSIKSTAYER